MPVVAGSWQIATASADALDIQAYSGSFNFTTAAEKSNAENLLIIKGYPNLVTEYQQNFTEHLGHAKPYERGGESTDNGDGKGGND